MNTALPVRPQMTSRIAVALPEDEKRKLFELAARRRVPAAELIRRAIAQTVETADAA